MKKVIIYSLTIFILFLLVGCSNSSKSYKWGDEKTFFDSVPTPSSKIDNLSKDKDVDGKVAYSVFINSFSYDDFYSYIEKLEKNGFHYEFLDDYVPKDINKLADKTETSWAANKGNIYVIANWRSNDNTYYNGYNLQLLFYNYDYTKIS